MPPLRHAIPLAAALLAIGCPARAQPDAESRPARILSIHPDHPTDADLDPILEAVGDARIVVLAAPTEGDGAAHWARARLARALVGRSGFSVIAFEAGFYDCWTLNQQLAAGTDASIVAPVGLPPQLAGSAFLSTIFRDAWRSYFQPQPTDICGFDDRHTGLRTARQLPRDLLAYLGTVEPHPLSKDQRRAYLTVLEDLARAREAADDAAIVRAWEQLHELRRVLADHRAALIDAGGEPLFEIWTRVLDDAITNAAHAMAFTHAGEGLADDNARQALMGERLVWIAQALYPGRRIVVFASTLTAIADAGAVTVDPDAHLLDAYRSAGAIWRESFGQEMFTIAFTAERGVSGWIQGPGFPVPDAIAGSVEAKLAAEEWPFVFLNLRRADDWWSAPRPSTLTGLNILLAHGDRLPREQRVSAAWPGQIDAVFFIEQQFANHWKPEPPEGVPHTVAIE